MSWMKKGNNIGYTHPELNKPTDKGFKIYLTTQFGDEIIVYGLTEDSTMRDIAKKLEYNHGSAMSKTGNVDWIGAPPGMSDAMFKFDHKDMKLKDLGIKPNSKLVWSTAYLKYKSGVSDKVSDEIKKKRGLLTVADSMRNKHPFTLKISLDKILNKNEEEIKRLGTLLKLRGWCLIEYPKETQKLINYVYKNVENAMINHATKKADNDNDVDQKEEKENDNDTWRQIADGYGYIDFKDYKQVIRVLTGNLMMKLEKQYPNELINDLKNISIGIDKLVFDIINIIATNVFGFETIKQFVTKCKDENCNITLFSGYNKKDYEDIKCGLMDFVNYCNIDDKKENSEYPMIKNKSENVSAHTDPGLFSLSFGSTADGLQLYDVTHDCWRPIPNECGVFWCGEAAPQISKGKIKSGIHRVVFNGNKPRFTGWYECSIDMQLTKAVVESIKISK